jgi:hypothetical protein
MQGGWPLSSSARVWAIANARGCRRAAILGWVTSVAYDLWPFAFAASGLQDPEPFLRWPGAGDAGRADGVIAGRFELHPAWNLKPSERRVSGSSAGNAVRMWQRWCCGIQKESVMGLGKKAKHEAKAVKGKTKKDAGKVKHKGKKAKNAAKH